jgi:hypothetical protein
MESRFSHDFSRVRVHTDPQAAESALAVEAQAYAVGNHIAFAPGRYEPALDRGRHLLAHELAHVVQAGGAPAEPHSLGAPGDSREVEAERAAARVASGSPTAVLDRGAPGTLARQSAEEKIPYVLTPPPPIAQGASSLYCWAAAAASWQRATGINPKVTRDDLISRFGACMDCDGALPYDNAVEVFKALGAELKKPEAKFDYEFVKGKLRKEGPFLLVRGSGTMHTVVVYGVGVDEQGNASKDHISVWDPLSEKYQNVTFGSFTAHAVGHRQVPAKSYSCKAVKCDEEKPP